MNVSPCLSIRWASDRFSYKAGICMDMFMLISPECLHLYYRFNGSDAN